MIEHRWSQRFTADLDVWISTPDQIASSGKIRNLSLYGLYIETATPYPENTYLQLRFVLPIAAADNEHEIGGLVVHRKANGMGLIVDTSEAHALASMHALKRCFGCALFPAKAPSQHQNAAPRHYKRA